MTGEYQYCPWLLFLSWELTLKVDPIMGWLHSPAKIRLGEKDWE